MTSHPSAPPKPLVPVADVPTQTPMEAFLEANFKKIVYAVIAVIVAGLVYFVLNYRARQQAEEAAQAATRASTIDDCAVVVQKYKGSVAAGNALLTKAKLEWNDNKKDTAVETLRDFVANYTSHPFYVQGLLSLASRLEARSPNDAKEAQSLFEKIVAEHKESDLAGLAQMRLGDLLWSQGKEDEAKKIYEELPRKFNGQFFDENQKRLDWIAGALPTKEVDGPKIPDALKAPATPGAPGAPTGNAPAINLTPGKPGGTSAPFEVKMNPSAPGAAPAKVGPGTLQLKPGVTTPGNIKVTPAPAATINPGNGPAPAKGNGDAPALKIEAPKTLSVNPQAQPVPTPAAPAAAPTIQVKPQAPAAPAATTGTPK